MRPRQPRTLVPERGTHTMTVQHQTVMFDVNDCKVAALLSDASDAVPVYGPLIDVPGISEVGVDPNFVTAELKGDARVIAKKGRIDRLNMKATYGKLDLDVQGIVFGSAVVDLAAVASKTVAGVTVASAAKTLTKTAGSFSSADLNREVWGTDIAEGSRIVDVNTDGSVATMNLAATGSGTVTVNFYATGEKAVSRIASPASLPYFKLMFRISDVDTEIGDLHVIAHKCQVTGGTYIGGSTDNFGQPSFDAEAIALQGHLPDGSGGFDTGVMVDTELLAAATLLGS